MPRSGARDETSGLKNASKQKEKGLIMLWNAASPLKMIIVKTSIFSLLTKLDLFGRSTTHEEWMRGTQSVSKAIPISTTTPVVHC